MSEKIHSAAIFADSTIEEAFRRLNDNRLGTLFVLSRERRVVGCVTDGDIRRQLLVNNDLCVAIQTFMNKDFISARADSSREQILKLLDHRVHIVPLLDSDGRLVRVCSRSDFSLRDEGEIYARARAPARVSFGGGGTDLTHYFFDNGGIIISATIDKFANAILRRRQDSGVRIYSHDLRQTVEAVTAAALAFDGTLDLIKSVVKLIDPPFGFELEVGTDFPVGSGLGGSAAVCAAIIGCFNEFREDTWDRHQISEMAFQAERLMLNIPGGWQDQYAATFGGFNYMEFSAEENLIIPLRLESRTLRELEASTLLCYTQGNHHSGQIHADQKKRMSGSRDAAKAAEAQKRITRDMKRRLLRGDISGYGVLLHEAWENKRKFSSMISNERIDRIYDLAIANGALGGKLLGAGGGGYLMFFVPPFGRYRLTAALEEAGYVCERLMLDEGGLQSWKMRPPLSKDAADAGNADFPAINTAV